MQMKGRGPFKNERQKDRIYGDNKSEIRGNCSTLTLTLLTLPQANLSI